MIYTILQHPDKRLKEKEKLSQSLMMNSKKLLKTCLKHIYKKIVRPGSYSARNTPRITVIDFSDDKDSPLCLINQKS